MASELRVNTLKDAAGSNEVAMTYVANGSAKCWVLFQGTGTVAINDSLNTASISDVGTGQYTVNFSNSMGSAFYSGIGSPKQDTSGTHTSNVDRLMNPARVPLLSSDMKFHAQSVTGTDSDVEEGAVHIMGDLA